MKIYVDADSCPVKELIFSVANEHRVEVVMVMSLAHWSNQNDRGHTVYVDNQFQAADIYLMNILQKGDILITQDYGLAAVALGKEARVLSPRGKEFTNDNIDGLLMRRHLEAKIRKRGGRHKGEAAWTEEDNRCFITSLRHLVMQCRKNFSSP